VEDEVSGARAPGVQLKKEKEGDGKGVGLMKGRRPTSVAAGDADAPRPLQLLQASPLLPLLRLRARLLGARGHADTGLQAPLPLGAARLRSHAQGPHAALATHARLRPLPRQR
jgi:hypothetical protein